MRDRMGLVRDIAFLVGDCAFVIGGEVGGCFD